MGPVLVLVLDRLVLVPVLVLVKLVLVLVAYLHFVVLDTSLVKTHLVLLSFGG